MKVGEIFIQLGFQSVGQDEAKNFQSIVEAIGESTKILADILTEMLAVLKEMSVDTEMAVESMDELNRQVDELNTNVPKATSAVRKKNDATKQNTSNVKEATKATKQWVSDLWRARLQFIGVTSAIMYATQSAAKYAQALNIFSSTTGLSSQKLQEWEQRAAASGITAEEMAATVRNLQKLGTDVLMGQGNTKPWAFLGIPASQNPFETLDRIKAKMGTLPRALESRMLEEMGLTDAMQTFLRESDKLPKGDEGLLLSEKELKRLKEFYHYFNVTIDTVKREVRKFGIALMPLADAMLFAFGRLSKAVTFIAIELSRLDNQSGGKVFKAITLAALMLTAALFPAGFALAGFLLIVEDVVTWLRGGKSVIGFWVDQFKSLKDVLEGIPALLAAVVDVFTGGLFTKELEDFVTTAAAFLKKWFGEEGVVFTRGDLKRKGGPTGANTPSLLPPGLFDFDYLGAGPRAANAPTNYVTVNVNGAQDPEATGRAVSREVGRTIYQQPVMEGGR